MSAMAQRRKRILISAVAAAVAIAMFAFVIVETSGNKGGSTGTTGTGGPQVSLVVAGIDLTAGTKLGPGNVTLQAFPVSTVPSAATTFTSVDKVANQYAAVRVPRGSVILSSFLVAAEPASGDAITTRPLDITAGNVAMSLPISEDRAAGGFIQPEDHLDILVDGGSGDIHYGFQDVRVLKVGGRSQQPAPAAAGQSSAAAAPVVGATMVVVELPREKAAVLAFLVNKPVNPIVRIVLRPHNDYGKGSLPNSAPVTGGNWTTLLDG